MLTTLERQSRDMRFDWYMTHAHALDLGKRQVYHVAIGSTLGRQSRDARFDWYMMNARAPSIRGGAKCVE